MRRTVLGSLVVAVALIAVAVILAVRTGPGAQPAGQLVVQGRVTGPDGQPVSGIKVWLNAWPRPSVARADTRAGQPVWLTVAGHAVTSATGWYAIRLPAPAALRPDAVNGLLSLGLMTGDRTGWDAARFTGQLVQLPGTSAAYLAGRPRTVHLSLAEHLSPNASTG
jgi:hypothetical protein